MTDNENQDDEPVVKEEGPLPPEVPFHVYESLMQELDRRVWERGPHDGETIH